MNNNPQSTDPLIIGIDSGATKSRVVLGSKSDFHENTYKEHLVGACNFRLSGSAGIGRLIDEIKEVAELEIAENITVLAGFAGVGTVESQRLVADVFVEAGFCKGAVTITSDAAILLAALQNSGVILICGTGSVCMGRFDGGTDLSATDKTIRAGGYGYRLVSGASGYRLGIDAINVGLRMEDQRLQEPSTLYDKIRNHFGFEKLESVVAVLYPIEPTERSTESRIAELAPIVLEAATEGDSVADQLISSVVNDMADHILAVCTKAGVKTGPVGLHGGLFRDKNSIECLVTPLKLHRALEQLELDFKLFNDENRDGLVEAVRFTLQ